MTENANNCAPVKIDLSAFQADAIKHLTALKKYLPTGYKLTVLARSESNVNGHVLVSEDDLELTAAALAQLKDV